VVVTLGAIAKANFKVRRALICSESQPQQDADSIAQYSVLTLAYHPSVYLVVHPHRTMLIIPDNSLDHGKAAEAKALSEKTEEPAVSVILPALQLG
jgi:hypothetical protein